MQSNWNDKTASSRDAVKVQEFLGLLNVVEFHPRETAMGMLSK